MKQLDEMRARLAAATPGPWADALGKTFKAVGSVADARLIVNAPTDMGKLIAAVDAVLALHTPNAGHNPDCLCGIDPGAGARCCGCYDAYPCPTVAALTAALEGKP